MDKLDCIFRADHYTCAAVITLTRIHDNRMFSLFLRRKKNVALTYIRTAVTADAFCLIVFQRIGAARYRLYGKITFLECLCRCFSMISSILYFFSDLRSSNITLCPVRSLCFLCDIILIAFFILIFQVPKEVQRNDPW